MKRTWASRRAFWYLLAVLLPLLGAAQCGPYIHHPVWPATMGYAYVNLSECGANVTSCAWDNGSTDELTDLAPGSHAVTFFNGATPLNTQDFQIDQVAWQLDPLVYGPPTGVVVENYLDLQYCPGQNFNNLACPPVQDSTVLYLLQDAVIIDSISPVPCYGSNYSWGQLPFGHVYQTYLQDHSQCGSYQYSAPIQTYTCEGAQLLLSVQDANGGADGSITVQEVLPDPLSLAPLPAPVTGHFSLFDWPAMDLREEAFAVASVQWEDLPPGEYLALFIPDSICAPVDTVITVDSGTGLSGVDPRGGDRLRIWPQPAGTFIHWTADLDAQVGVLDAQGRIVRTGPDMGAMEISSLPSGPYHLQRIGGRTQHARFLKQ